MRVTIDLATILQDFFHRRSDIDDLARHTHFGLSRFSRHKRMWERGIVGANSTPRLTRTSGQAQFFLAREGGMVSIAQIGTIA